MNFDINLPENHTYTAGDLYTNDQWVSCLIAFIYPEGTRACCDLTGASNTHIKLKFNQTSDDFRAISLVNGEFVLTTAENRSTYCGLIFPATKDENGNVTSVVPQDPENPDVDFYGHRAYLLPLR